MPELYKTKKSGISNGLYVILDKALVRNRDLKRLVEEVIKGGSDVIQLRDKVSPDRTFLKDAQMVRDITKYFGIQFIVNDRVDIAKAVDADGVHLGQDDLPIDKTRSLLGRSKLIGISCHSLRQAITAQQEGASYIGLGSIFRTPTKQDLKVIGVDLINKVKKELKIPIVCIGGINAGNIKELLDAGAEIVAISSAIVASDEPRAVAQEVKNILEAKEDDTIRICQE